jgi:hypothetical protein
VSKFGFPLQVCLMCVLVLVRTTSGSICAMQPCALQTTSSRTRHTPPHLLSVCQAVGASIRRCECSLLVWVRAQGVVPYKSS